MVLVDSDILIEVTRARDADVLRKWTELSQGRDVILYSPVSVAELWQGARPTEFDRLNGLFGLLVSIPIDARIGKHAGELLQKYRKSHSLELADALIAASAIVSQAELWTRNRRHYPMKTLSFF